MRLIYRAACCSAMAAMSAFVTIPSVADDDLLSQIEATRAEIIDLMEGIRVTDADLAMSIPLAPIARSLDFLNASPPEQRTIMVNSTSAKGYFWKDDATWCGSYAELGGSDGLRAAAVFSGFGMKVHDANSIEVSVNAAVSLQRANVHWHFMGRRVNLGIGNACPPGGGFGGNIGATGRTSFSLLTLAELRQEAGEGGFHYDFSILSPATINMTLEIGFRQIGNLGIPQKFDVPKGPLASGKIPLLFQTSGVVKLPDGTSRNYSIVIAPKTLELSPTAASGSWTGKVEFDPSPEEVL